MNYFIVFLFFIFSFTHCGMIQGGAVDRRDRNVDREPDLGELSDEEFEEVITDQEKTIKDTFEKLFKNLDECETSAPTLPQNKFDLFFSVFGAEKYNAPQKIRTCVQDRVEKATFSLCTAKEQVYAERNKYGNQDIRAERTEAAIRRIDKLHNDYRRVLIDGVKEFKSCRKDSNDFVSGECEALRDILLAEAAVECNHEQLRSRLN